jgi:DHA1 family tetracycline resistance protein-like MFS transporter
MGLRMDRVMALLALLVFTDTFGYAIVLPLLPLAAQRRGAGALGVGILFATYSACQLLCAPMLGRLSDRWGRRPVLLTSLAGSAAGFALMLAGGYWVLILSRLVDGATAGNVSVVNAIVLDRYPRTDWGTRFTVLASATGAGILSGVVVSAGLAVFGLAAAALVAIALNLVSAAIVWMALPETAQRERIGPAWKFPSLNLQFAIPSAFAATIVQSAFLLTLPLYLNRLLGWHETQATTAIAVLIAVAAAFQILAVARVMTLFGARRAAIAGFGLMLAGGLVLALAAGPVSAIAGGVIAVLGVALLSPAVPTMISTHNQGLKEGEVMGINQSVASAGQMAGPLIGYGALGLFAAPGYGFACAALCVGGLALTYPLRTKR